MLVERLNAYCSAFTIRTFLRILIYSGDIMGKRASIKAQFVFAVGKCFRPGVDKHALKKKKLLGQLNDTEYKMFQSMVWSYGYKNNLLDFTNRFVQWLRVAHPGVKYLYELNGLHWSAYLRYVKESTKAPYRTIKTYKSYIHKLEAICSYAYPHVFDFTSDLVIPTYRKWNKQKKVRDFSIRLDVFQKLVSYILERYPNPKGNALSVLFVCLFGLRAGEVQQLQFRDFYRFSELPDNLRSRVFRSSPYDLYMRVKGKNGRIRVLPVEFVEQYELIQYVLNELPHDKNNHYITSLASKKLSEKSLRKFIRSILIDKLGYKEYAKAYGVTHALRKTSLKIYYTKIK